MLKNVALALGPDIDWRRYPAGDRIRGRDLGNGRAKMNSGSHNYLFLAFDFPFPPNDLPSNPGRLFPFRRSAFIAMLSVRFFCRAAIDAAVCSFLSCLQQCDFRDNVWVPQGSHAPSLLSLLFFFLLSLCCFLEPRFIILDLHTLHAGPCLFPFLMFFDSFAFFFRHGRQLLLAGRELVKSQ